jgi:hypothetical protein
MTTQNGKTVFVEYSTTEKGQHFMTVIQTMDHKRQIIGRIYREYDKENKRANYKATDWEGNQIFVDVKDLPTIKKKYIESGKELAMVIPVNPNHRAQKERETFSNEFPRTKEVKQIRERKTVKKEKVQENKEPNSEINDRDEELQKIRKPETKHEPEHEIEPENREPSEKSERESESEQIRDRGNETDRDQEQEVEIEI